MVSLRIAHFIAPYDGLRHTRCLLKDNTSGCISVLEICSPPDDIGTIGMTLSR